MKKTIIGCCIAFMAFAAFSVFTSLEAFAQVGGGKVSGIVTDANGPAVGAAVFVKGGTSGVTTDMDGEFTVTGLKNDDVIVVSLLGYQTQEIVYTGQVSLNIVLKEESTYLEGVVVTAMGVERQSETLTYTAETIGGKDVNDIKNVNMINSLQGKSAGLVITPNSTGAGGSSKILFRGNKSISGSNQPLIVIDGVPVMQNITTSQVASNYGGERDGGDVMSTVNPDDIKSITLLKGASAAALYGAVAANGAIMITTKSAASGRVNVNISSNTTVDTPMNLPDFQNNYGMSDNGTYSWGDKLASASPDYLKKFFRTGVTTNNSIAISGGSENFGAYLSYGNVYSEGITPQNEYMSHNVNAKVNFTVLKKIHIDASAKFTNQHIENQAASGFLWNPLTGAYLFPRGEDWGYYKNNFEIYEAARGVNVQNWTNTGQQQYSNPYWVLNRQKPISDRNRYEVGGSIRWDIIDDLYIQGRLRYERGDEHFVHNAHASSIGNLYPMGRMKDNRYFSDQMYGDVLIGYNHIWKDTYMLSVTAGSSFTHNKTSHVDLWGEGSQFVSLGNGNIYYPNIFTPNNYFGNMSTVGKNDQWNTEKRLNAVFATAQFGYKNGLFIDLTARNDWSSSLAFTDSMSFFYPSAGVSFLLDRFVDMGKNVDLLKFRASYSIVGNDVPVYMSNLLYSLQSQGSISAPENAPFRTLKPEMTNSIEAGIDGTFFQDRMNVSFTWYKTNTKNQFFSVSAPYESGLRNRYINAGNVQNQGFEFNFGWYEPFTKDFSWETNFNISYNDNKIKTLVDDLPNGLTISDFGGAKVVLKEGGSYGDLYVRYVKRDDNGKPLQDESGKPILSSDNTSEMKYVGNMNSKVYAGWTNTFRYKNVSLSFLIDARFGGRVVSMTEAALDGWGVSARSGAARDAGSVVVDGVSFNPRDWYETTGASNFNSPYANENYVYSATNIRLRELSLGYTFRDVFGPGKNITASLIGRNLFFFYKKAPVDPDVSAGTGNGWQGIDVFALPTTRSFGLNLKLNF
ncbi:MAG: SusC/RagA family TonB-linked outer membrane protein [Bacteroidales bacterium]|nr:SusC/RagA family TonB-linked outer membrane protein [Bacteroidales bacterium]